MIFIEVVLLSQESVLEEFKRAYIEFKKIEAKRGFITHLIVYTLVNTMLTIINMLYTPKVIWFFYPLIGWRIGLAMNYLHAFHWIEHDLIGELAKAEQYMKIKKR